MSALFHTADPPAFGLDFSDRSVKLVSLRRRGKSLYLATWGHAQIPLGLVEKGEVRDEAALAAATRSFLKSGLKGERLRTRHVILALPEQHSFVRVVELPPVAQTQAGEAVRWEAEANIPLPIDEMELDWQEVAPPGQGGQREALIAATPKKVVAAYLAVLRGAGLTPLVIEVESMALARSIVPGFATAEALLIMDVGETDTSFVIFDDDVVQFTSSVSLCGVDFTKAICRELGISEADAEQLKVATSLDAADDQGSRVAAAMRPLLDALAIQIQEYLQYYLDHAPPQHAGHAQIRRVFVSGGGANVVGLPQYLSRRLSLDVELANPWINVFPQPMQELPAISYQESLAYTTAIGLALRGVRVGAR
ncbi:type IV pilus assembly protein PilM [Candidatus Parcubacteria bacterium]|nr:type IV pilus assembly protein PilM [Candidatus Parcubacteria bacterium]